MEILVVLGHRLRDNGSPSEIMLKRLSKALEVEKDFDKIICCGGLANPNAGITEAEVMSKYLIEHGVSEDKIIKEDKSTTTKENAMFSKDIIASLGEKSITLLSSRSHIYRCYLNPKCLFRSKAKVKIKKAICS